MESSSEDLNDVGFLVIIPRQFAIEAMEYTYRDILAPYKIRWESLEERSIMYSQNSLSRETCQQEDLLKASRIFS